jgi:dolichyl-diphosphooligosaccharide--protein glycosyltransferase
MKSDKIREALAVFGIMIASLLLRVILPYNQIFTDLGIKYNMNDAYYHMRIVDNLVANFPHLTFYDPYYILPDGAIVAGQHFFDWLIASVIWVIGLGHPAQHLIDTVGAYFPAMLGALMVIPVYLIAKELFNKWAGIIASALIAVFAGEFYMRSMLGATDHHIAEVFFSTIAMLFIIFAIKATSKKKLVLYSVLGGVFLGAYLLTWFGGLLFVGIISLYLVIQSIINHLQHRTSVNLGIIGVTVFPIAFLMNLTNSQPSLFTFIMAVASVVPLILYGISRVMKDMKPLSYWIILFSIVIVGSAILKFVFPSIIDSFKMFMSSEASSATTMELQPIFYPDHYFTTVVAWKNYTMSLILMPISFIALIWYYIKNKSSETLLLVVWTLVMVVLTLMQRRYAYYLTVNVSIVTGWSCYLGYQWVKKLFQSNKRQKKKVKKSYVVPIVYSCLIFVIMIVPNYPQAKVMANVAYAPSDAWQSSLLWLKDNSVEPFEKNEYLEYYPLNPNNVYIKPNYGVTAWWDYGYWITRIAQRVPNTNPAQSSEPIKKVSELLLSSESNEEILSEFKTKYIMLDYDLVTAKLYALAQWIGEDDNKYFEYFYAKQKDGMNKVTLFYPEYYQTLAVRLYNFNGLQVTEGQQLVITYSSKSDSEYGKYKMITSAKVFNNYNEAEEYAEGVSGIIVGGNPFISPIKLEAMSDYKLVHSSKQTQDVVDVKNIPEVKIFEYVGSGK